MAPLDLEQEAGCMPEELVRFPRDVVWKPGDLEESPEHTVLIQVRERRLPQMNIGDFQIRIHVRCA